MNAETLQANPPSSIRLTAIPLVDTFGSAGIEHAAALIVRTCHARGDRWQAVLWEELDAVMRDDLQAGTQPMASLLRNPFFSPDFDLLVERQWGAWNGPPGRGRLELAPRAIAAMVEKWGAHRG